MSLASVTIQNNKYSEIYQTYREYIKNPLFYPGVVNLTATMNMVIACAVKTPLHCSFPRKKVLIWIPVITVSLWYVHTQFQVGWFMYKVHKGSTPSYFSAIFCLNENVHTYVTIHRTSLLKK